MKSLVFLTFSILFVFNGYFANSQISYDKKSVSSKLLTVKSLRAIDLDYQLTILNLESPFEGNSHYRHFLHDLKLESAKKYPVIHKKSNYRISANSIDTPMVIQTFEGNRYNYSAPNDNTMAVNKDGIVLSAINTNIIFYDSQKDSLLKTVSLSAFSDTLSGISTHQYDPKVIYDYQKDRFILVNLSGASSDATTHIIVAFQLTADVLGEWAFYAVQGNPLNDTSWTDFPAISLTNDELFITGNLLKYGGSWQTSFKQSVIWQINKNNGFNGDSNLDMVLYSGIKYNGVNIRNLHPVMGGDGFFGPEMYFLSNKNFAIQNDTFFLLKTSGLLSNSNTSLDIRLIKSTRNYGAPPNPQSPGNKRLATNDARVLGAFLQNDIIQFVGNTIDTTNGYATIYHGLIYNPASATKANLTLIKNDSLQFGYPNISYCGTHNKSTQSIINVNYVNLTINPGFGVIFFQKENEYSDFKVLKKGDTYISVMFGGVQRWGDYSGSQPVYGEKGKVWVNGTYGRKSGVSQIYGTWISLVASTENDEPLITPAKGKALVFPNPSADKFISVMFESENKTKVNIDIIDMNGRIIRLAENYPIKAGSNMLTFNTLSINVGFYLLNISDNGKILYSEKISLIN